MRYQSLFAFSFLAAATSAAFAEPAALITAVTLYPGSATVVRNAQVEPGMTRIAIPGLPAAFDSQTLRAEAGPGIRIGDIVVQDMSRTEAVNPAEADLNKQLEALLNQLGAVEGEIKAAELVKGYLERLGGDPGSERHPAAPDAKTLAGQIDTLGRSARETLERIHQLNIRKRELNKRIEALQRDLQRLATGNRDKRLVIVNVAAEKAGTLKLSYQVPNAGWKPAYRAALDSAAARVDLERLATISQKTGEDWSKVKLTLSTTRPRQGIEGTDPQPYLLRYQPPRPAAKSSYPVEAGAPVAYAPMPASERRLSEEDSYRPPTFEIHGTFATAFEVPTRVTLPSDGREVSVLLASQSLAVKQYLKVVPRADKAAYVTAEAPRPAGVWPAGNVQLFRDGNYLGSSPWNPPAAEPFVFSFGRDELLRVSVDAVKSQSGSTGIFDKGRERHLADVFTFTSSHRTPVDLLILESSPVSTADAVKVEATFDPKPGSDTWKQRRGVVAWERTLVPNETARISVDYRITYPQEGSVPGLD